MNIEEILSSLKTNGITDKVIDAYLDVFAGALQAYVFAMLTMVFIANAADIQEE